MCSCSADLGFVADTKIAQYTLEPVRTLLSQVIAVLFPRLTLKRS
jgi:hypothetical protein